MQVDDLHSSIALAHPYLDEARVEHIKRRLRDLVRVCRYRGISLRVEDGRYVVYSEADTREVVGKERLVALLDGFRTTI